MNLKDRLIIAKQNKSDIQVKNNNIQNNNISDIFVNAAETENIIRNLIKEDKNIIFITNNNIDKTIIAEYIQILIKDRNVIITEKPNENDININSKVRVYTNTNITDMINILGFAITGCKPSVFCLNINSYKNIIEKIKTLIAIERANLSTENINTLLTESEITLVNITENDNKLIINDIDLIENDNKITLKNIYSVNKPENKKEETDIDEIQESGLEESPENDFTEEPVNQIIDNKKEAIKEQKETTTKKRGTKKTSSKIKNILIDDELMNFNPEEHTIIQSSTPIEKIKEEQSNVENEENNINQFIDSIELKEEDNQNEQETAEITTNTNNIEKEQTKPINKYKLLREKIHSKKISMND
ncbi:hypothetical protein IJ182_06870 [bacterium]|nr:hypothetical protein [bacterium]